MVLIMNNLSPTCTIIILVATYPFYEDEPPPFELIQPFCNDMDVWLKMDDRNVAVVHCNDGLVSLYQVWIICGVPCSGSFPKLV